MTFRGSTGEVNLIKGFPLWESSDHEAGRRERRKTSLESQSNVNVAMCDLSLDNGLICVKRLINLFDFLDFFRIPFGSARW